MALLEGTAVHIGTLQAARATEGSLSVQVIVLKESFLFVFRRLHGTARVQGGFWPPNSLKKGVHCEVVAGSADDPSQAHHAYRMKVWLGLLDDALVGRISYEESDEPECSFKAFGALSGVSMVPFGPALASIAGEHFAFVTAVEGPEEPGFPEEPEQSWESRLTGLEAGVSNLQKSLERLLGAGGMAAPATAPPVETPAGAGVGLPIAEAPLPGLDPTVVGAARQAGS